MPEISLFFGIRVTMDFSDHDPARFHASYAGRAASIDIENACVLRGSLPNRQLHFVIAWCFIHQDELMQNWELARDGEPLNKIAPLM